MNDMSSIKMLSTILNRQVTFILLNGYVRSEECSFINRKNLKLVIKLT